MFSTDAAGSVEDEIAEESQGLLQEFIDYIKVHKVVVLEELAANFGLRTEVRIVVCVWPHVARRSGARRCGHVIWCLQEAVNRVRGLEEMGYITGVIDDRGKFIYISEVRIHLIVDACGGNAGHHGYLTAPLTDFTDAPTSRNSLIYTLRVRRKRWRRWRPSSIRRGGSPSQSYLRRATALSS
jgi:hypothetical protein